MSAAAVTRDEEGVKVPESVERTNKDKKEVCNQIRGEATCPLSPPLTSSDVLCCIFDSRLGIQRESLTWTF